MLSSPPLGPPSSAEDEGRAGSTAEDAAGPDLSTATRTDPIITAAQMLECIDVLCASGPCDLDDDEIQMQMAMARAAGLFELVGNTEESVLWSGIAEVLESLRGAQTEDAEGDWLTEEDERYAMERYPIGGGSEREKERGEERELGDVMDKVLGALGVGGMPMPMPMPSPEPVSAWVPLQSEIELESAW